VADVAPSLAVVATSDDGLVEGMELPGRPLLSVQWHPERQTDSTCWATLATWLVEEARTYVATRTHETTRAEVL
jgi:putative glutamine amidotransferase